MGLMKRRFSIRIAVMGDFMLFITLYVYIPTYVEAYHKKGLECQEKKPFSFQNCLFTRFTFFLLPTDWLILILFDSVKLNREKSADR